MITLRPSFPPPACLSLARPSSFEDATVLLYCCGCTVSSAKTSAADLLLGACRPTERHSPCISSEQTTIISVTTTQVARGHGSSSIRAAVRSSCSSRISIIHHPATFPSIHLHTSACHAPAKFSHAWLTQMHTSQYYPLRQQMLSYSLLVIHRSYSVAAHSVPYPHYSPITTRACKRDDAAAALCCQMHVVSRERPVRVGRHLLLFSHYLISLACRLPIGIVSSNEPVCHSHQQSSC